MPDPGGRFSIPSFRMSRGRRDLIAFAVLAVVVAGFFAWAILNLLNQEERHVKAIQDVKLKRPAGSRREEKAQEADLAVEKVVNSNLMAKQASFIHYEMSDDAAAHIARLKNLEILDLSFTRIGDGALSCLTRLPLRQLMLMETRVSDAGMRHIAKIKSLEYINLTATYVTDEGLKELRSLPHICDFHLGNTGITDVGVREIAAHHKRIWKLLLNYTDITNECMKDVATLPELTNLWIDGTRVDSEGLSALAGHPKLSVINMMGGNITDADIPLLVKTFPTLRQLNISHTKITDRALESLAKMNSLKVLDVDNCPGLTREGANRFRARHPECRVIPRRLWR